MKILLTGITSIQTNTRGPRSKRDYSSFPYILHKMLMDLGHRVTFAPYHPHIHNLSSYDRVLIGLAPTSSRVSVWAYNAFLAMQHERKLFYLVDWDVKSAFSKRIMNDPFGEFVAGCNKLDPSRVERKIIEKKINWFFKEKHDVMAQMFNWGNHDIIKETAPIDHIYAIDPTSCVDLPKVKRLSKKNYQWVTATLKDNEQKLGKINFTWDLVEYNKNNYRPEKLLITEDYTENWGVIALPYYHRGCGWFRSRILHAAHTNSVLLAHPDEVAPIAEKNNPYLIDVAKVEAMSHVKLNDLANAQRKALMSHVMDKSDTLDKLDDILRRI